MEITHTDPASGQTIRVSAWGNGAGAASFRLAEIARKMGQTAAPCNFGGGCDFSYGYSVGGLVPTAAAGIVAELRGETFATAVFGRKDAIRASVEGPCPDGMSPWEEVHWRKHEAARLMAEVQADCPRGGSACFDHPGACPECVSHNGANRWHGWAGPDATEPPVAAEVEIIRRGVCPAEGEE